MAALDSHQGLFSSHRNTCIIPVALYICLCIYLLGDVSWLSKPHSQLCQRHPLHISILRFLRILFHRLVEVGMQVLRWQHWKCHFIDTDRIEIRSGALSPSIRGTHTCWWCLALISAAGAWRGPTVPHRDPISSSHEYSTLMTTNFPALSARSDVLQLLIVFCRSFFCSDTKAYYSVSTMSGQYSSPML